MLLGPCECVVGDVLPSLLSGHEMRASREFLDFRDRVRLVVLCVGALDRGHTQAFSAAERSLPASRFRTPGVRAGSEEIKIGKSTAVFLLLADSQLQL